MHAYLFDLINKKKKFLLNRTIRLRESEGVYEKYLIL